MVFMDLYKVKFGPNIFKVRFCIKHFCNKVIIKTTVKHNKGLLKTVSKKISSKN